MLRIWRDATTTAPCATHHEPVNWMAVWKGWTALEILVVEASALIGLSPEARWMEVWNAIFIAPNLHQLLVWGTVDPPANLRALLTRLLYIYGHWLRTGMQVLSLPRPPTGKHYPADLWHHVCALPPLRSLSLELTAVTPDSEMHWDAPPAPVAVPRAVRLGLGSLVFTSPVVNFPHHCETVLATVLRDPDVRYLGVVLGDIRVHSMVHVAPPIVGPVDGRTLVLHVWVEHLLRAQPENLRCLGHLLQHFADVAVWLRSGSGGVVAVAFDWLVTRTGGGGRMRCILDHPTGKGMTHVDIDVDVLVGSDDASERQQFWFPDEDDQVYMGAYWPTVDEEEIVRSS